MSLARRTLPPLSALRALEALDRLGSATAVAEELNLTQSAVSRQLKTLEDHLATQLFLRDRRALRLTPQASAFAATVRDALDRIAQGALSLRLDPSGGALNLSILPSFGMRWLVPRLPDFAQKHPDVTVNMATRLSPFSFAAEPFDAAIHFGRPETWPGTHSLALMVEEVRPLAAPALLPDAPVPPSDLTRLPLLHIQSRPNAWPRWFAAHDIPHGTLSGTSFDQFTTIAQAALHGMGVALLPDFMTRSERATGQLRPATETPAFALGTYHLVWPADRIAPPALSAFIAWLENLAPDEERRPR